MPIESSFSSLRSDLDKMANKGKNVSFVLSYDEAYDKIINDAEFKESISTSLQEAAADKSKAKIVIKDKQYFRDKRDQYKFKIGTVIDRLNISVRDMDRATLLEELVEDIFGYKCLKDLYYSNSKTDPYGNVTDIFCLSWNKIYYESSKSDTPLKYEKTFKSPKDYRDWIERMLREAGKSMLDTGENKVIDFDLYEDRYNAISKAVAPNDYSITMRKHSEDHVTLDMILSQGGMSQDVADLYGLLIAGECNTIMAGVTGSGKTTSMRAVLDYYVTKLNKRMLVCEDTRELFPKNDHTLELQTSPGTTKESTVGLGDLVTLALRQKPKYIIVGEVRAAEAEAAVEAMATGHSTHFTMHAGVPIDAVNRLVTKYLMMMPSLGIDVVERIIGSAVDYIMIQDAIPGIGRRITSITEVDYDYAKQRVALKTICRFDVPTKSFVFENRLAKIKADKMLRKGIKPHELSKWAEGFEQYALDPNEPSLFECDKQKEAEQAKEKEPQINKPSKPHNDSIEDDDM